MSAALVLVALLGFFSKSEAESSVQLSVYYESLCPDSANFFERQLKPTYGKMASFLNVELIPYGNAHSSGRHDEWKFQCQHGSEECYGNMVQSCFITLVNDTNSQIKFVDCAFRVRDQKMSLQKCIPDIDVRRQVKKCATSALGKNILYEMGKRTDALSPPHSFIPWIVVDGVGGNDINNKANDNLMSVVCDKIEQDEKPEECLKNKWSVFRRFRNNYL